MDQQTKRNSGTSADLPENFAGCLRVRWTTHPRSRLKTSRSPVLAPPVLAPPVLTPPVLAPPAPKMASALDDAEAGAESTRRPVGSQKRK
jgi:hypothetical protein